MQILRRVDQLLRRERLVLLAVLAVAVIVLLSAGLCGGGRPAYATDTGFLAPSASAAGSPTCDSTGNGLLSDNTYVACEDGENFVLSGFGATVPAGAIILGIRVELEHRTSYDSGTDETCITLSWDGGITFPSSQNCANTNADGAEADDFDTIGTVTDDWGHVWTPAEVNDLYLQAEANSGASTMSIDGIRVAIEYTLGKSGFLPATASAAGSPTCDTPGNALLSDDSYVLCEDGEKFVLSGFGLDLPAGSTIDGIRVEIEHRTSLDWFTDQTCITLSWDGGATFPSNQDCANTNADGAEPDDFDTVGAVNGTWGHAWTVAEINDVYLQAEANSGASTMSIDQIRVWVSYTPPSGTPTDTPAATDTPAGTPTDTPVPSATPTSTPTPIASGFLPPSASAAGSVTCDTVGNALLSDDAYVLCEDGESFVLSGFGLNVPVGSTIDGIQVEIEHRTSLDWFTDETCITLSWDGGVNYPSNQNCANTNADGAEDDDVDVLGGIADDWGHVWTVAEINDLYVRAVADSGFSTMSIDRIRVSVAYTPPTPTPTPTATATATATATPTTTNTPVPVSLLPPEPTATSAPPNTAVPTPVQALTSTPEPPEAATATPTASATPPALSSLAGDVDCGGYVDGFDALLILQFDAGLIDALPCADGADANGDGRVNCMDAMVVMQLVVGLLDGLSQ